MRMSLQNRRSMLLPDPFTTTGLAVLNLMLVLDLAPRLRIRGLVRQAKVQASGVPSDSVSIETPIYLRAKNDEVLLLTGMFWVLVVVLWLLRGFPLWDTNKAEFFLDGDFLLAYAFYLLLLVVLPTLNTLLSMGEYFTVSIEGISRYQTFGGPRSIRWDDLKEVSTYKPNGGVFSCDSGTIVRDEKIGFMLSRHMNNIELFYREALVRIPKSLMDGEAAQFFERELEGDLEEDRRARSNISRQPLVWLGIIMFLMGFGQMGIFAALFPGPQPVLGPLAIGLMIFLFIVGVIVSLVGIMRSRIKSGFVNVEHVLPGTTSERAYSSAQSWLEKEGARIEEQVRPSWISALHGTRKKISVWDRDSYKKIVLRFEDVDGGVKVKAALSPASALYADDIGTFGEDIRTKWTQLAEELWTSMEG